MDCGYRLPLSNSFSTLHPPLGRKYELSRFPSVIPTKFLVECRSDTRVYANKSSAKNLRKATDAEKTMKPQPNEGPLDQYDLLTDESSSNDSIGETSIGVASRSSVLKACTVTSGFIAALGIIIRQVSHLASRGGWPVVDCSTEISFNFEIWHLELIAGLVILISSSRFILLKTWPDFAESSEASNKKVLTLLEPFDYVVVAFLPGISEELLFRGALLPLFGINLTSASAVAVLFGILHLGSGRKYSFALWATFVGFVYGYATIASSSILVPMASHAINNLVGGIIWRATHQIDQS